MKHYNMERVRHALSNWNKVMSFVKCAVLRPSLNHFLLFGDPLSRAFVQYHWHKLMANSMIFSQNLLMVRRNFALIVVVCGAVELAFQFVSLADAEWCSLDSHHDSSLKIALSFQSHFCYRNIHVEVILFKGYVIACHKKRCFSVSFFMLLF